MIFLGYAFAGGNYSLDPTPINQEDTTTIKVSNSVVGDLFATNEDLTYSTDIPSTWNFYTIMHGKFSGNLLAGNIDFTVSEVDSLRVERRKKGSTVWTILYEQVVTTKDDLNVLYYDKTARANTTYEYAIVPVFDQVEGTKYSKEITTDYQGIFVIDGENVFSTELDVSISKKRNKPRSVITPINRKYPFTVSNGENNYNSGSVSAQWLEYDPETDDWDKDGGNAFVDSLEDFLNNGLPKLIKYQDGRMWLVNVTSPEITETEDENHLQIHTSFDWTEIGDCESVSDLYDNGLMNNVSVR